MKHTLQHDIYGEIVYIENAWTGKKRLFVNGVELQNIPKSKKEYMINNKKGVLKGNFLLGVTLSIEDEIIQISPKSKWYEVILSAISAIFIIIWGNEVSLCRIFPIIGGAIGGALGGISIIASLPLIKQAKKVISKILIGIASLVITAFIGFILALVVITLLY